MKAITYYKYGLPDFMQLEDVDRPVPRGNEVVVRVKFASVNPMEQHIMGGNPVARLTTGLFKPKNKILGADIAGIVDCVGTNVALFKPGDEVFGDIFNGGFAEYACTTEDKLALKPQNVSFEDAAVISVAGLTALQGLRDVGKVKPGDHVLINGASGGVGHFAVQIAKARGARVTAVCSAVNHDFVRSIGADEVIDYQTADFTAGDIRYDIIYDAIGNRNLSDMLRVLSPVGRVVLIGMTTMGLLMRNVIKGKLKSKKTGQHIESITGHANSADLTELGELMAGGKIKPQITKRFSFRQIPEAIKVIISRRSVGKILINIEDVQDNNLSTFQ